jgi:hypothetical protein
MVQQGDYSSLYPIHTIRRPVEADITYILIETH